MKRQANEYLTIQASAEALGVSRRHVWTLVKKGVLSATENPLDRRSKVIKRGEIEKLADFASAKQQRLMATDTGMAAMTPLTRIKRSEAPRSTQDARPRAGIGFEPSVQSRDIDMYLADRWRDELSAQNIASDSEE